MNANLKNSAIVLATDYVIPAWRMSTTPQVCGRCYWTHAISTTQCGTGTPPTKDAASWLSRRRHG